MGGDIIFDETFSYMRARQHGKRQEAARILALELLRGGRVGLHSPNIESQIQMIDAVIDNLKQIKDMVSLLKGGSDG